LAGAARATLARYMVESKRRGVRWLENMVVAVVIG
jgi:hypothetical protein